VETARSSTARAPGHRRASAACHPSKGKRRVRNPSVRRSRTPIEFEAQRNPRSKLARSASEAKEAMPARLARASGSIGQSTAIVTLSERPVVSVAALLELAHWLQQRRPRTEELEPCTHARLDNLRPPFPPANDDPHQAGTSPLAAPEPRGAAPLGGPPGPDDPSPPPQPGREPGKRGAR
jgi:hypothetical protein